MLGENHPDTLRSELQFAQSLTESGLAPEAVLLLSQLVEKMTRLYGEMDPRTLRATSMLANALSLDRRHEEADPLFRVTLDRQREVVGEDHRDILDTMLMWAESYNWRGRGAASEELTRPVYDAALRMFGPDDVITLSAQASLGWCRNFQRDYEGGEALLRPALEGLVRTLGAEHPLTCTTKMALGRSAERLGGSDETERLWREALEDERLFAQAELAEREALREVEQRWHGDPAASAGLLYRTGRVLLHQGRVRDAETLLREGVARARATDDREVLNRNQVHLAEALIHQRRYEEGRAVAAEVDDRETAHIRAREAIRLPMRWPWKPAACSGVHTWVWATPMRRNRCSAMSPSGSRGPARRTHGAAPAHSARGVLVSPRNGVSRTRSRCFSSRTRCS